MHLLLRVLASHCKLWEVGIRLLHLMMLFLISRMLPTHAHVSSIDSMACSVFGCPLLIARNSSLADAHVSEVPRSAHDGMLHAFSRKTHTCSHGFPERARHRARFEHAVSEKRWPVGCVECKRNRSAKVLSGSMNECLRHVLEKGTRCMRAGIRHMWRVSWRIFGKEAHMFGLGQLPHIWRVT